MSSDTIKAEKGIEIEDITEKVEESVREMLIAYEKSNGTLEENIIISINIGENKNDNRI
ncbi:MAG: hypothetical protein ACOC1X_01820 [Promethearchaeota archaeon]